MHHAQVAVMAGQPPDHDEVGGNVQTALGAVLDVVQGGVLDISTADPATAGVPVDHKVPNVRWHQVEAFEFRLAHGENLVDPLRDVPPGYKLRTHYWWPESSGFVTATWTGATAGYVGNLDVNDSWQYDWGFAEVFQASNARSVIRAHILKTAVLVLIEDPNYPFDIAKVLRKLAPLPDPPKFASADEAQAWLEQQQRKGRA